MKTLLKRIPTTKKKIVDLSHENFIISDEDFHENSDNDLFEYNKSHTKKDFLNKERQIFINSCYDNQPKKQQKEIFLATVQNIKKHINKMKIQKQQQQMIEKRQSLTLQIKRKSNTEMYNEPAYLTNHHLILDNDKMQTYFSNRKIKNTPKNVNSQPQDRKNVILNNYFNKPKTNRKSLVKQNHNTHLQKILRIRENIRLKNASLKVDDIFSNTKIIKTKNSLKRILSSNKKTRSAFKYADIQQEKINSENDIYQNYTLIIKKQNTIKCQDKHFKSNTLQETKQIQSQFEKKIKRMDSIKRSKFYSRTPQLLHQVIPD